MPDDCPISPVSPVSPFSPEEGTADGAFIQAAVVSETVDTTKLHSKWLNKIPQWVRLRDQLMFSFGVLNLAVSGPLLLVDPFWIRLVYTAKAIVYFALRYWDYRSKKYQYFLLDFCYFGNLVVFLHVWFLQERIIECVAFSFAMGPLLVAVAMWHNSFVFHSFDKMSSLFLHLYPALLMFHQRFWASPFGPHAVPVRSSQDPSWWELVAVPMMFYFFWQVLYVAKVFIFDSKIIRNDPSLMFSVRYLTTNKKSFIYKMCHVLGDKAAIPMYFLLQALYTLVSMIPCLIWYYHPVALAFFVGFLTWVGAWNGGSYYIWFFATRYGEIAKNKEKKWEKFAETLANPKVLHDLRQTKGLNGHSLKQLYDALEDLHKTQ